MDRDRKLLRAGAEEEPLHAVIQKEMVMETLLVVIAAAIVLAALNIGDPARHRGSNTRQITSLSAFARVSGDDAEPAVIGPMASTARWER
jgi:hypothetical protein